MSSGATSFLYVWKCCWTQTWDVYVLSSALWRGNTVYSQREASQVDAGNTRATQRRRPGWRGRGGCGSPGAAGEQVGRRIVCVQSFNEPGNSLVNVCQRSIFLSLFLRQSNQCLSLSPFALIPRDTPPKRRHKHRRLIMHHIIISVYILNILKQLKNNIKDEKPFTNYL